MSATSDESVMRLLLVLLLLTFCKQSAAQSGPPAPGTIGEVEFFATGSTNLQQLRADLPIHEGDPISVNAVDARLAQLKTSLTGILHHPPSNVAVVCCDAAGKWMFYLGLNEANIPAPHFSPPPHGRIRLPDDQLDLYAAEDEALGKAVMQGDSGEDDVNGYALMNNPAGRRLQLQFRRYAVVHGKLIRRVSLYSSSLGSRRAATQLLGYCLRSPAQLAALDHATRDPDQDVRNNATRALSVLADSSPAIARSIPPGSFIAMLNSGDWTDRNKSSLLLISLTETRESQTLDQMRREALPSLVEMARWRSKGHAYASLVLLGRIAGIDETKLNALIGAGQTEQIILAAKHR